MGGTMVESVFSQQLTRKSSSLHSPSNTFTMKIAVCFLTVVSMTLAVPTPQRGGTRNNGNTNTRFFTGNQAIDSAAFGAAAGVAGNYLFNAVTNPCRNGNRNNNKGTNN